MHIAVMLVTEVIRLSLSLGLEIADIITECVPSTNTHTWTNARFRLHGLTRKHALAHSTHTPMVPRRNAGRAFSIFASIKVLFDESLDITTELRTAYAFFIILSMVVAAVSIVYRIVSARRVHKVRNVRHTCAPVQRWHALIRAAWLVIH
jgi:hypothetical protein